MPLYNSYLQTVVTDSLLPVYLNNHTYQIVVHSLYLTNSQVGIFELERDATTQTVSLNIVYDLDSSNPNGSPI